MGCHNEDLCLHQPYHHGGSVGEMAHRPVLPAPAPDLSDHPGAVSYTHLRTGIVTYRYHGHTVGSAAVTLTQEYVDSRTKEPEQDTEETHEKTQEKRKEDPALARVTEILVIAAAAVVLLAAVWIAVKKRQRRRRHRRK